jgi:hypothetical protein
MIADAPESGYDLINITERQTLGAAFNAPNPFIAHG